MQLLRTIPILLFSLVGLGCAELQILRARTVEQDKALSELKEENRGFREAYYEIKQSLEDEVADHDKDLKLKEHELQQTRTLKTEQEKQLGDDLRSIRLEYQAFQEDTHELKLNLELKISKLERSLQQMIAERDAARSKMAEIQRKLGAEKDYNAELTHENAEMKIDIQNRDDRIASLQNDIADLKQEKDESSINLQAATGEIQDLKDNLSGVKGHVHEMEGLLAATDEELELARDEIKKLAAASSGTVSLENYHKLQSELDQSMDTITGLKSSLTESAAQLEASEDKLSAMESNSHDLQRDRDLMGLGNEITRRLESRNLKLPCRVIHDHRGVRLVLASDDLFDRGTTVLATNSGDTLAEVGKILSNIRNRIVIIEGHTDNEPVKDMPFPDNWRLGYARADSLRRYLMENTATPGKHIRVVSRADQDPVKDHSTKTNRKMNRRVEIVIAHRTNEK